MKRLFQSGAIGNGFTPAGVLADFLEVETRYESVVEEFLRDELNYVVVKSWDSANEGMRLLQSDVDGRATFLVHPEDSQAKFSFAADDAPPPTSPRKEELVSLKTPFGCWTALGDHWKSYYQAPRRLHHGRCKHRAQPGAGKP